MMVCTEIMVFAEVIPKRAAMYGSVMVQYH